MRIITSLNIILSLIILSGCSSLREATPQQKKVSLSKLDITQIDGEPANVFVKRRIAQLFDGVEKVALERVAKDQASVTIRGSATGSAIAISEHGYYLTAAHCIEDVNSILLREGSNLPKKAKVIWKSDDIDLGVIKVDGWIKYFFSIADSFPDTNTPVILGSSEAGHGGNSAGIVLSVEKAPMDYSSHAIIYHSCPISSGDSGGPLITLDGKLLGVNHSFRDRKLGFFLRYKYSMATAFDISWLQQLIENDITSGSRSTR
jgi:S1-C subfamily serine protease